MPKKIKKPKPSRRARGTGSIMPDRRRGGWIGRVPVGKYPNKKTKYRQVSAATQAEVVRLMRSAGPPGPTATVAEWAERWLAAAELREQSRDRYRQSLTLRILPHLGRRRVAEVTTFDVEEAARAWGQKVSASTINNTLAALGALFGAAVRARLCQSNPVSSARKPRAARPEIDPFTLDELDRIVEAASTDHRLCRLAVMTATGCRIGEALALQEGDYNPATRELSITRTRTLRHGVGPAKSPNSVRTVRVPNQAHGAALAIGREYSHDVATDRWRALLKKLGLRYRNPHQTRHSIATHAIAAGVPIANVARDLGDTVETIVSTYLHPVPGQDVCGAIEGLLSGARVARTQQDVSKMPQHKAKSRRWG